MLYDHFEEYTLILVQDKGVVIRNHKHSQNTSIVTVFGVENGKWSGFYRQKAPLMLGTFCEFSVSVKSPLELGSLSVEILNPSEMGKLWKDPIVMTGYAVICESASRFIPEGIGRHQTFILLSNTLLELGRANLYESIRQWENHILQEYMDKSPIPIRDIIYHCKQTKCLDTKIRQDLLALLKIA